MTYAVAVKQLETTDASQVRQALEALKAQKSPRSTPHIAARIKAGLPPPLLLLAIDTIAALPRGYSSTILLDLITHRSTDVRVRSIEAAAALNVPGSDRALMEALDDGEGEVRTAAVQGLVQIKARRAIPTLFTAFERQVPQAAEALGQLAGQGDLQRIEGYLDELPFRRIAPILRGILSRDDIPDRLKVRIINRLERVNTADVSYFLRNYLDDLETAEDDPVRQAVLDTLDALAEAARGETTEGEPAGEGEGETP